MTKKKIKLKGLTTSERKIISEISTIEKRRKLRKRLLRREPRTERERRLIEKAHEKLSRPEWKRRLEVVGEKVGKEIRKEVRGIAKKRARIPKVGVVRRGIRLRKYTEEEIEEMKKKPRGFFHQ